jgi:hypothetical protein
MVWRDVDLPAGSVRLAISEVCENQAFQLNSTRDVEFAEDRTADDYGVDSLSMDEPANTFRPSLNVTVRALASGEPSFAR